MHIKTISLAIALSMTLLACGGGGGGDSSGGSTPAPNPSPVIPPPPPPVVVTPPPYTVTPGIVEAAYVAGYPVTLTLTAKQTVPFVGIAYVKLVSDADVIDPEVGIAMQADGSVSVQVKTSASAKPGLYSGNFTINVCNDPNCTTQLEGAPFKLPYAFEVMAPEGGVQTFTVSRLSALEGASDWATFQGNSRHDGYVPVTLNPAAFSARWKLTMPATNGVQDELSEIATGAGRVYVANGTRMLWNAGSGLSAYGETDGARLWSMTFADEVYGASNPPAYANGRVFASAGSHEYTAMYGVDAASGARLFRTPMGSQWPRYRAPTVVNGSVYTTGGTYGGMYSFDAASGTENYFVQLGQHDRWTPAFDGRNMYSFMDGKLQIHDLLTGQVAASVADPLFSWNGYSGNTPIVGGAGTVYAGNLNNGFSNAIVAFDSAARSVRWSTAGDFAGSPAVADGLLFTTNNATFELEVRRESDGAIAWSWPMPQGDVNFVGDVLLTRNLVFVSTTRMTYAIDRTTHATVWSYKASGKLALSANGILYVKDKSKLVAINLK